MPSRRPRAPARRYAASAPAPGSGTSDDAEAAVARRTASRARRAIRATTACPRRTEVLVDHAHHADVGGPDAVLPALLVPARPPPERRPPDGSAYFSRPSNSRATRGLLVPGVQPPDEASLVVQLHLQLRQRQSGREQPQPPLRLERRLRATVGQSDRACRSADPGPVTSREDRAKQLGPRHRLGAQRGVERDDGVQLRPLPGAVDQRARHRRRPEGEPGDDVAVRTASLEPRGTRGRSATGPPSSPGRRAPADGGTSRPCSRAAEAWLSTGPRSRHEQHGDAIHQVPIPTISTRRPPPRSHRRPFAAGSTVERGAGLDVVDA